MHYQTPSDVLCWILLSDSELGWAKDKRRLYERKYSQSPTGITRLYKTPIPFPLCKDNLAL